LGLDGLAGPFIILVWSRLRRITARFARYAATPFPIPPRPQAVIATAAKPSRRRPKSKSPLPLPRHAAWLLRLVPETASGASQLRYFLADPEVASLLATTPQLQAILRPLCHMLGMRPLCHILGIRAAQVLPPPDAPPDTPSIPCVAPKQAVPIAFSPAALLPWTTPPPSPDSAPPAPALSLA
jgi:hypothetical protein